MNVLSSTITQPNSDRPTSAVATSGRSTSRRSSASGATARAAAPARGWRTARRCCARPPAARTRPPALEALPRHDAVLDGEQPQQQHIDDQRFRERHDRPAVDGLRHRQAGDEADGVKKRAEKQQVGDDAVEKCEEFVPWQSLHFTDAMDYCWLLCGISTRARIIVLGGRSERPAPPPRSAER